MSIGYYGGVPCDYRANGAIPGQRRAFRAGCKSIWGVMENATREWGTMGDSRWAKGIIWGLVQGEHRGDELEIGLHFSSPL